ncbi:PQQ-binding-like beta-propeller repeat protein [Streptomyces sp. NPDC096339]|uniref:outer membrane protein assembly factor BamB family protein n=1 Tax=Streptomyces sp. NPDC096339 TaxID=3366086 RepID=UPI0038163D80
MPFWKRLLGSAWPAVTAALGAVALLYFVLFLKLAFADMDGNKCGGGTDCPRGMGALMLSALLLGLLAVGSSLLLRKVAPLTRSCLTGVLAAVLALVALWPGWLGFEWMRGPQMYMSGWQAPDKPSSVKPVGVWAVERWPVMVRARTDGLVSFNGEGRHGWRLGAPERMSVCALSRTTPSDIGVVAYDRGEGCGARVEAVELTSGKRLWGRDTVGAGVAAVGGTAVVADKTLGVIGLDLRGGGELWRAGVPGECAVRVVDGAGERVLYVEECGRSARVTAVDSRTGARVWQTALPVESGLSEVRVLSAQPLALRVKESAERGTDGVLLFDGEGRTRGSVPVAGAEEELLLSSGSPEPLVSGELLVVPVRDGKKAGVSAYSLTDGHRAWHTGFGRERVLGLGRARGAGEVAVVTSEHPWTYLTRLDLGGGGRREESTVLREVPLSQRFAFWPGPPGSYVFVNLGAYDSEQLPPTFEVLPVWGW